MELLKECLAGKHGSVATEVKVIVLSLQGTPAGMFPYLPLAGLPQTKNENNTFGTDVMEACEIVAKISGNAVILDTSTDGVSCEVQFNKALTLAYLEGDKNQISLPDTNHNVKNSRYQLLGGSSPASIGHFTFDPWMLMHVGIAIELIRVDQWAHNEFPLRLE